MFAYVFLVLISFTLGEELKVQTSSGNLLGKRITVLDKTLKLFLGVPYAVPPVGNLRFQPALPLHSERVERDATSFAPSCYQPPHIAEVISPLLKPNQIELSEDCLYLNIYVPDARSDEKLPVMVWLAGEGFNYADAHQFDGKYLAALGNVIVVTINYRVSVFGFLSTLSDHAPGNAGLFDQRLALKWVKENIVRFGGNPDKVTLFGRFSGAMSAAIHAFSPLSKNEKLFRRIILHSGVPDGEWVFDHNPLNGTLTLAESTDCLSSDITETLDCLRRIPADILLKTAFPIPNAWRPVYDFNLIYEHTLKAAKKENYNPVDVLIGLNKDEGSLCLVALKAMHSDLFEKMVKKSVTKEEFKELVSANLFEVYKESDDLLNKLALYKYQSKDTSELRDNFVQLCGDLYVSAHSEKLADILSSLNQKVYLYELAHRPSFSIHPSFIRAAHGDDVLYALGLPLQLDSLSDDEKLLTKKLVQTITNFARFGNPNMKDSSVWPPYSMQDRLLMQFHADPENDKVQKSTHINAVEFWHDIIPAARKHICPLPPMASALVQGPDMFYQNSQQTYFLGALMTVPTAEYMMLALLCTVGFLLFTTVIALFMMIRIRRHAMFQRLK